ncbi:MAG: NAD(P)/FAD-dependent oxidoreductase [Bacteroidota bacterium]
MQKKHFDVLIIGAGISGISAAYYLQRDCPTKSYAILEGRQSIGGTWDLFKYPGIRSDSDMYTLGFRFRPWTSKKAIADGPSIMNYLQETIAEFNIDQHIVYEQRVVKAAWSSAEALWTLEVQQGKGGPMATYTCNFLSMCTGYYNYEAGYTPNFAGIDQFSGQVVHPQKWTEDVDYTDKKVVVIGSGATAVTLIPELAKKAQHVTMLQRSPTYMVAAPDEDGLANFLNKILPYKLAYSINRWRKILFQRFSFWLARSYPNFMKKLLIKGVKNELGTEYDVDKHFTPKYNVWDQRVCLAPNGDIFEAIKDGKASVATDHIESFVPEGIQLKSGRTLPADLVVTATGLDLKLLGGIDFSVDDEPLDLAGKVIYKSMMFSDVPNLSFAFGYTNASWTLKCDLSNSYVCRLINYMDEHDFKQCTAQQNDASLQLEDWLDFSSGYIKRKIHLLPKQGDKKPWKLKQNYLFDRMMIEYGKVDDGVMIFSKPEKVVPEPKVEEQVV